jgi:ribonucleoside-diphosphate reductase alpha chain
MLNPRFEEDRALKHSVISSIDQKPNFNWRGVVKEETPSQSSIHVMCPHGDEDFDIKEVIDTIGKALTNVLLSRHETDIFTEENQRWVERIAREVGGKLDATAIDNKTVRVALNDLYSLIERTLVENNAWDVAKSILVNRSRKLTTEFAPPTAPVRLIRRNNQVVPWNVAKIEIAVRKAFLSLEVDSAPAPDISHAITQRVLDSNQAFVRIEEVQDMVQEELMRAGFYKVAEHYILYRARRAQMREQEISEPEVEVEQKSMVVVRRSDGDTYFWDGRDLKRRIEFAMIGLDLCLTAEEIETELRRSIFDEISQTELNSTLGLNAKTLIEKDADFAKFAGRIQLTFIYEEVLGWDIVRDGIDALKTFHRKYLAHYLKRGIEIKRLNPRVLDYDIKKLSAVLDPSADLEFDFLGIQTLYDRYLIVDKTVKPQRRIETPQIFWMRVSMGLFIDEEKDRENRVTALYELYKSRCFCSSTPTLFNSGSSHSQLSSCYLYWVDDSIEGIMQRGIAENAYLSKWAGGLGGSWTSVRGTGSHINGTNGESQGIIPFLKLHNDQLVAVNQGGKRRGSGCAYLESWHNDLFDFLELRKNVGDERRRTHDMNTANWIPDLFMKRMEAREHWTFFHSSEVPELHHIYGKAFEERFLEYEKRAAAGKIFGRTIPALDVWKRMLQMLFETGHPWITFKDPCNIRSPQDHVGVIHSSNLCTEITLNTGDDETAVCNLGSIILDTHLDHEGNIDLEKLRSTVRIAVRALDNVIDINFYPTDAARRSNQRHRPIGLGVMGLQNALYMRNTPFASQEAVEFNDEAMEAIAYFAYEASSDLAGERGAYSTYQGSKWDRGLLPQDTLDLLEQERGVTVEVPRSGRMDWTPVREKIARQGMRNSNVLAIAPTATISNIMGTSPCIEPSYKNLFVKSNLSGEFIVLNTHLVRDLKARDLWNQEMVDNLKYFDGSLADVEGIPDDLRKKYQTAFDIDYNWLIDAAARRQKWIDQSQSVNLFLGHPEMKTLSHMYRAAWRRGLKTTYYLRTLGASNIEKATVSVKKEVKASLLNGQNSEADNREYTEAERVACSIESMRNGEECEACQ